MIHVCEYTYDEYSPGLFLKSDGKTADKDESPANWQAIFV